MKSIDDLRKALFGWRQPLSRDNALRGGIETSRILDKLTDPTPITEAGLRELGFRFDPSEPLPVYRIGETMAAVDADGACGVSGKTVNALVRGMGKLRGLLLSVGE